MSTDTPRTAELRKKIAEQLGDSPKSSLSIALQGCEDLERSLAQAEEEKGRLIEELRGCLNWLASYPGEGAMPRWKQVSDLLRSLGAIRKQS